MRIIFDISGTVLGALDGSLRPGIADTISSLRAGGCEVDFWTSGRVEVYGAALRAKGIEGRVFSKLAPLPFVPDVCVDDEPEGWMPGAGYRVDMHVSEDLPGAPVLTAELLFTGDGRSFFWD